MTKKANPIYDEQGELVCEAPAPSMPLYFWNDPDGSKYHHAYFDVYPNVWRHGDYVLIHSDTGGHHILWSFGCGIEAFRCADRHGRNLCSNGEITRDRR